MRGGTTCDKKFENMISNAYSYQEVDALKGSCVLNLLVSPLYLRLVNHRVFP